MNEAMTEVETKREAELLSEIRTNASEWRAGVLEAHNKWKALRAKVGNKIEGFPNVGKSWDDFAAVEYGKAAKKHLEKFSRFDSEIQWAMVQTFLSGSTDEEAKIIMPVIWALFQPKNMKVRAKLLGISPFN